MELAETPLVLGDQGRLERPAGGLLHQVPRARVEVGAVPCESSSKFRGRGRLRFGLLYSRRLVFGNVRCSRLPRLLLSSLRLRLLHFVLPSASHRRLVDRAGMRARTLTLGSAGKLFALTGWRVGWAYADCGPGARAAPPGGGLPPPFNPRFRLPNC